MLIIATSDDVLYCSKMATPDFNFENLINAIQNEPCLWDSSVNASEEDKDLAWKRVADSFGIQNGNISAGSLYYY
jgi:hypothetical protein